MKNLLCYTLCLSLILFTPISFAKDKGKPTEQPLQLHQYVLSSKQIQMLSPQDQIKYLSYLTSLVYLVEASQFRANHIIPSYSFADASFYIPQKSPTSINSKVMWQNIFKEFASRINDWVLPSAHGWALPALAWIGRGVVAMAPKLWNAGKPLLNKGWSKMKDFVVRKAPDVKSAANTASNKAMDTVKVTRVENTALKKTTEVIEKPWTPEITRKFDLFGGLRYYAGKFPITTAVTAGGLAYEVANYLDDSEKSEAANKAQIRDEDYLDDSEKSEAANKAQIRDEEMEALNAAARAEQERIAKIDPEKYKQTGGTCLYAGYISTYQEDSKGQFWCNRPSGIIQEGTCPGVNMKPRKRMMVQCNSFGLTNDADLADEFKVAAQEGTCIPLYNDDGITGIKDLSHRCAQSVFKWYERIKPQLIHTGQYDAFAQKLKDLLTKFEKSATTNINDGTPALSFEQYCLNENFVNMNYQKAECGTIIGVLNALKKDLDITKIVAKNSAAPTAKPNVKGAKDQGQAN
ncbi:MAG: hypothetical protein H6625_14080 [Bdellovibrionaceae bacterium]|nr:hypothetical protein [Pseudobdellovibrionaceae bacterium]